LNNCHQFFQPEIVKHKIHIILTVGTFLTLERAKQLVMRMP
jgi:uracil-DNA glycosylase